VKTIVIALGILFLNVGLVYLSMRQTKKIPVREMDQTIVETYCRLIADGKYEEAYDRCLAKSYRDEMPLADFIQAHEKYRAATGVLQSRELIRQQSSSNLFTGEHTHQLQYDLVYPESSLRDYIVLTDADGEYKVEGTYTARGEGLNFKVW
jgi:hypothetical protein